MARSLLFLLFLTLFACNNLEDATIPERQTFIRFFGSARSYVSVAVEPDLDGGFIMVGNAAPLESDLATPDQQIPAIVIVKTDAQGTKLWEKIIPNANVHSIKPLADGYLLTGEGIELNPSSSESSEFVNTQFLLLKLSATGEPQLSFSKDSSVTVTRGLDQVNLKVDFKASASVVLPGGTEVATIGSYKVPGSQERTVTMGFSLSNFSQPLWRKNLDLFNFDYINPNFLGFKSGNLVWASTATPQDINQSKYVSVIAVPPNYASPSNNSLFGKTDDTGGHDVKDIETSATGFGIVGTYTSKAGNKNVFFVKVDPAGNVMESTVKYFDGVDLAIEKTNSGNSQDEGTAITFTKDGGFVLACAMGENPTTGHGGTDIVLIKIDAFGNFLWHKLMGGSGDEIASSIRELSDGTLVIAGTSTISNVSSMFIIRADGSGNLKD
ncbi:MAG TPA: hypothetical protein VK508_03795 [Cyclobacteriaceae bacterium]|nr:hypothetical protein [Cyclobacteriaceae bacterium]